MTEELLQTIIINNHKKYFRDFPWRHKTNPYEIMIAEFMLHRTKAEQVVPVYNAFLHHYPDIITLSTATYSEISIVTQHLGLHWRSYHFLDAAKFLSREYGGIFPDKRCELLKIPGIGEYASGAILVVCFNKREYVVDSNIARFINRFFGLKLSGEIRDIKNLAEDLFEDNRKI